jgi:hypothetical protein
VINEVALFVELFVALGTNKYGVQPPCFIVHLLSLIVEHALYFFQDGLRLDYSKLMKKTLLFPLKLDDFFMFGH